MDLRSETSDSTITEHDQPWSDCKARPLLGPRDLESSVEEDGAMEAPISACFSLMRHRKSTLPRWAIRSVWLVPFAMLVIFGIIHLILVSLGGSGFYWSSDSTSELDRQFRLRLLSGSKPAIANITYDVMPIPVHSHNDYLRRTPLYDALYWGCISVEVDIWHLGDDRKLYVGHNKRSLTPDRTLDSLYITPLVQLLDALNGSNETSSTRNSTSNFAQLRIRHFLLIDFKTAGPGTLSAVSSQLEALRSKDYLSYWDGDRVRKRAVTVVASGKDPVDDIIANSTYRDIFIDAPLDNLFSNEFNTSNAYYASVSFQKTVGRIWGGRVSAKQLGIIRKQVRDAHDLGLKARYWDTPAWPVNLRNHVWDVLMTEGADILNADALKAAAVYDWTQPIHKLWS